MSVSDPVADLLVALKNASLVGREEIIVSFSNLRKNILNALKKEKFIEDYTHNKGKKPTLTVKLKYHNEAPAIRDVKRISKVSRKRYVGKDEIPSIEGNRMWLLSTSKGVLTGEECKKEGIGGELLCYFE
jgi:small subunit ribosomal protein S8